MLVGEERVLGWDQLLLKFVFRGCDEIKIVWWIKKGKKVLLDCYNRITGFAGRMSKRGRKRAVYIFVITLKDK